MGGLAMVIPKKLRKVSKILECESWRLQPVLFQLGKKQILIINSYFPTDPKTLNNDNRDLVTTLAILINIIEATTFHSLYLAGRYKYRFSEELNRFKIQLFKYLGGNSPPFFPTSKLIFSLELKLHVKFQNPRTTPSGRKVTQGEVHFARLYD